MFPHQYTALWFVKTQFFLNPLTIFQKIYFSTFYLDVGNRFHQMLTENSSKLLPKQRNYLLGS